MIDTLYWQRQQDLKQRLDILAGRVTRLEMAMQNSPPTTRKQRTPMERLKAVTDIGQAVITGHGLWPILLSLVGLGWRLVSKMLSLQ